MNKTIVVLSSDGGWGKAQTLAEAFGNCPYKSSKSVYSAYAYNCAADTIEVDGMGSVNYPHTATSIPLGLFKGRISLTERKPHVPHSPAGGVRGSPAGLGPPPSGIGGHNTGH